LRNIRPLFILITLNFLFGQEKWSDLNINLMEVWSIEEPDLKQEIRDDIHYYSKQNPEDSLKIITSYDEIIVIEDQLNEGNIYQIAYGNRGKFNILNNDKIKLIFSERLRNTILPPRGERPTYFREKDKSYLTESIGSFTEQYFTYKNNWSNRDYSVSLGSPFIVNKLMMRLTSIGGVSLNPSYAFSVFAGNEMLGFPNISQGILNWGILNKYFSLGIQTPIPEAVPTETFRMVIPESDTTKNLQSGFGGYASISAPTFGLKIHLSFNDFVESQYLTEYISDSVNVDFMSFSFLSTVEGIKFPLMGFAHVFTRIGIGNYQISHRSLLNDGTIINRNENQNGDILDVSESTFMGPVLRLDLISNVRQGSGNMLTTLPFLELFAQVNAYKNNKIIMAGGGINIKNIGVDVTYSKQIDPVDWMPDSQIYLSFNLGFNRK
tara:strand:- start:55 stop:1362 length:1308 start_codon:yes stop_codon:yes gene_type:complete